MHQQLATASHNNDRHPGDARLTPRVWDHQWYTLASLRRGMQDAFDRHALLDSGQRVADVGCGDRPYEPIFRDAGCEYVGCDIEGDADVVFEPGRPIDLPDESIDGVLSIQVLEHVWDLDWYLGECRRILKPGGWMLLSTHGSWLYHPHPTDFRRWTRDGLVCELQTRGFDVQTVIAKVGPLAWTTQFRLLGYRHVFQRMPVVGACLAPLVSCVMNLRMVAEEAVTPASIRDTNAGVYITVSRKSPDREGVAS